MRAIKITGKAALLLFALCFLGAFSRPVSTANIASAASVNDYRKQFQKERAFTAVDVSGASKKQVRKLFYKTQISNKLFERIYGKSYKKNCTVPKSELRYVRVLHYGFDQQVHIGELITNKSVADEIRQIFYELYQKKYEIEKMVLVDEYDADDDLSMADNNTSCFNFRKVTGTAHLSKHSYGLAIDVNPRYNPYVYKKNGKTVCEPENGKRFLNRKKDFAHKITKKDACYRIFTRHGFSWGGDWKSLKDYQHFQKK